MEKPEKVVLFPKLKLAEIIMERAEREHVNVVLDLLAEFQRRFQRAGQNGSANCYSESRRFCKT